LLYYWAKFFKQDVSIVIGTKIQNWVPDTTTGLPKLLTQMFDEPLKNHSAPTPLAYQHGCNHEKYDNDMSYLCRVPYRDFAHFMGHNKPWQHGYSPYFLKGSNHNAYAGARRIWFKELIDLNTNYSMGIDFKEWEESKHLKDMEESPLGYMAMYLDHQKKMLQLRR
jgi:lipopolysaccharide biosynthesis glycosyltransferase